MDYRGSVPEPLLPPNIVLHNPHLIDGDAFYVYPKLSKIIVMIDHDGDENYQPMAIPIDGGYPQPTFDNFFAGYRVHVHHCDIDHNLLFLVAESRTEPRVFTYRGNLDTGELALLGESPYGLIPEGVSSDLSKVVLWEEYTLGDSVLYISTLKREEPQLIYGVPMGQRAEGEDIPGNFITSPYFTSGDRSLLFATALFEDTRGLGYFKLDEAQQVQPVRLVGVSHQGAGELDEITHLKDNRYLVKFNIDGASWLYEGCFDEDNLVMSLDHIICGVGELSNGVLEHVYYDKDDECFSLAFSTATSPTQIYTVEGKERNSVVRHTNERILAIPPELLSPGEDASFTSLDGIRVSARLYLPSPALDYEGQRPIVYYIHGGPQSQERPDFAWFSMPLIQFLTLNGFAVFTPNVRGSTGYGLSYARQVDRDWGGQDRLDHVHALTKVLPNDSRLDTSRAGVVGRSYGGYMTLTLAGRHPRLWAAAVDMFGPYDLLTFSKRIPETWKPYFKLSIGDPEDENDRKLLIERSPCTYLDNLSCPMLVIQGKNDPRVVERESSDLVHNLRTKGKEIEYLLFENEGHDVLKYENRVTCYNAITDFFKKHLKP
jgi:pimeloyl-ACP methyl ester carboxylesterase